MKRLSWKPVRKGKKFCSPGCGHGCSHVQYNEAKKKAAKLASQLGEGWMPDVWENIGWFFRAKKGDCNVYDFGYRNYWADLHFGNRQFHAIGTTPKKAVKMAVDEAKAFAFLLTDEIEEFEK